MFKRLRALFRRDDLQSYVEQKDAAYRARYERLNGDFRDAVERKEAA